MSVRPAVLRTARVAVLTAIGLLLVPWPGPAARAAAERVPLRVERTAWFTARTDQALPPAATSEFPPEIACLLFPEVCSAEVQEGTQPLEDAITGTEIDRGPVHPVAPGTLPVGLLGGVLRYASLMSFTVPEPPENPFVESFELILSEDAFTYAVDSPAFREAVRAVVAQAAHEPSPEPFERFLQRVASQDAPLARFEPTGIEVCAVAEAWQPGDNHPAARLPELDCAFGANGRRDDHGTWTFDLSLVVQGWLDGTIPNHGIYLGPVAAANLEYGDPDVSANFQISLAATDDAAADAPAARVSYASVDPAPAGGGTGELAPPPPAPAPASFGAPSFGGATTAPPPPAPAGTEPTGAAGEPFMPARYWLLLPLGLAALALFSRAFEPATGAAGARGGALSRLTGDAA